MVERERKILNIVDVSRTIDTEALMCDGRTNQLPYMSSVKSVYDVIL